MSRISLSHRLFSLLPVLAALLIAWAMALPAFAAGQLPAYLQKVQPAELFEGADRFGEPTGEPPIAPVYRGAGLVGYAYLNSDVTSSVGYSGKPIHIIVGIDGEGVVRGFKLIDHKEPIVLIGIPQAKVVAALNSILNKNMARVASGAERPPQVDIVSGATVTVLVMGDSVIRSAVKLIRTNRLKDGVSAPAAVAPDVKTVNMSKTDIADWQTLVGDGSVRSLRMTVGEVSERFRQANHADAADRPETPQANDRFIDLYIAPVSVPAIGKSLLGESGYQRLASRLKPGQSAVLVAGDGAYSFKGSGYVRGGIFDRDRAFAGRPGPAVSRS